MKGENSMTSEKNIGAPVRVEQHDPELVAAVAKAKALDPGEVKVVGRLTGLRINEATAHDAMMAAKHSMEDARQHYLEMVDAYAAAVSERRKEEGK